MKHLFTLILFFLLGSAFAQSPAVTALVETQQGISVGMTEASFFNVKPSVPVPDGTMGFRSEATETVNSNGLESITYYFDNDGEHLLYEMIINFSNESVRAETATSLFGAPNHPTEEGGWILSVKDDYNLIAWAFDNKLVIAANIPGSEWDNDPMFSTPSGYAPPVEEQPTTKPAPSAWTNMQKEISQMVFQMELEAGAGDFKTARGEALDNDPDQGYFKCILVPPLAEEALVVRYDDSHWLVNNTMYSALSLQEALQYEKELGAQLPALFSAEVSLVPADTKELFGSTVQLWDVLDKKGTRMAIQVGTTHYEWNVENSYNVALLLIQE